MTASRFVIMFQTIWKRQKNTVTGLKTGDHTTAEVATSTKEGKLMGDPSSQLEVKKSF